MSASEEIIELRNLEKMIEIGSCHLDRLAVGLIPWPRHIVIMNAMPWGTWAVLPPGWQTAAQVSMTPQAGLPAWRGPPIAVSPVLAEEMIRYINHRGGDR